MSCLRADHTCGQLCDHLKLFTALVWILRSCSSTYLCDNIYCPPTVFPTEIQMLGKGGKKVLSISMPSTLLKHSGHSLDVVTRIFLKTDVVFSIDCDMLKHTNVTD